MRVNTRTEVNVRISRVELLQLLGIGESYLLGTAVLSSNCEQLTLTFIATTPDKELER